MLIGACAATMALAAYAARRAKHDFVHLQRLSSLMAALVWLAYLVHTGVTWYWAWCRRLPLPMKRPWARRAGLPLIGSGLALYAAGRQRLASFRRISGSRSDMLVTDGIFHWSRNPQLTGWGLALLGIAVLQRSGAALLTIVWWVFVHRTVIPIEEQHLARSFGQTYLDYQARTARYLGHRSTKR